MITPPVSRMCLAPSVHHRCDAVQRWCQFDAPIVVKWFSASLGGQFQMAGLTGSAPNHGLYDGDLLIAKRSDHYHVGETVVIETYRNGASTRLIAPIVGDLGSEAFLVRLGPGLTGEPWPISQKSILGQQALVIPHGATVASLFVKPWFLGLVVAALVAVMLWPQRPDPEPAEESGTVSDPHPQEVSEV